MLVINSSTLPHLTVGKIILNEDNLNVSAFLTTNIQNLKDTFDKLKGMFQYYRVYFVLSTSNPDSKMKSIPPEILVNSQKRISNMAGFFGLSAMQAVCWYDNISKNFPSTSISLTEILDSSLSGNVSESKLMNRPNGFKDINFQIKIPFAREFYKREEVDETYLHAFIHLDIKSVLDDKVINRLDKRLGQYIKKGGNCRSRKLFQKDNGIVKVQSSTTVLAKEDGTPFNGEYFYSNQGPEPGYYSKKRFNGRRLKLKTVNVNNRDLVSSVFLNEKTSYNGYEEEFVDYKKEKTSFTNPIIEDNANPQSIGIEKYSEPFKRRQEELKVMNSLKTGNNMIVYNAIHTVQVNNSISPGHIAMFNLDWHKFIKLNTKFGFMLDIANNNQLTAGSSLQSFYKGAPRSTAQIIDNILIKRVVIKREKIKKEKKQLVLQKDEQEKEYKEDDDIFYLQYTPKYQTNISYETENFSLQEDTRTSNKLTKKIRFVDRDLYKSSMGGEYQYTIGFEIEDKNSAMFLGMISSMESSLVKHKNFVEIASQAEVTEINRSGYPIVGTKDEITFNKTKIKKGNIHPSTDQYTAEFLAKNEFGPYFDNKISVFIALLYWRGKIKDIEEFLMIQSQIRSLAHPNYGGTLSGAEEFQTMCSKILLYYRNLVSSINLQSASNAIDTTGKIIGKATKPSTSPEDRVIYYKIPGYAKPVLENQLMLSYGLNMSNDSNASPPLGIQKSEGSYKKEPTSIISSDKQPKIIMANSKTSDQNIETTRKMMSKSLVVDDAIKNGINSIKLQTSMDNDSSLLFLSLGMSGVSVGIPSQTDPFVSDKRDSDKVAEEHQTLVSKTIRQSLNSSFPDSTNTKKIKTQKDQDILKTQLAEGRGDILRKTMNMLAAINQKDPITAPKHKEKYNVEINKNPLELVFKSREGILKIPSKQKGPELQFENLTIDSLSRWPEKEVPVLIEISKNQKGLENVHIVDNVIIVNKASLKELLKQTS